MLAGLMRVIGCVNLTTLANNSQVTVGLEFFLDYIKRWRFLIVTQSMAPTTISKCFGMVFSSIISLLHSSNFS
jgi:hypothetical protein